MLRIIGEPAFAALMRLTLREKNDDNNGFRQSSSGWALGEIAHERDLPILYKLVNQPQTRRVGLEALSGMGLRAKAALPRVGSILKKDKPDVADQAAWAIAVIDPADNVVLPYLCRSVAQHTGSSYDFEQIMKAKGFPGILIIVKNINGLLSAGDASRCIGAGYDSLEGLQTLQTFLSKTSDNHMLRMVLVGALGNHVTDFEDYMNLVAPFTKEDSSVELRRVATTILIDLIGKELRFPRDQKLSLPKDVIKSISTSLEFESDEQVKGQLLEIISDCSGFSQKVYEDVARILKEDKSPRLRVSAAAALKSADGFETIAANALLGTIRNDPVVSVRLNAIESLDALGIPIFLDQDIQTLLRGETSEVVRERIVRILKPIESQPLSFEKLLVELCESDPSETVRESAAQALVRVDPVGPRYLTSIAQNVTSDHSSRLNAIAALTSLQNQATAQALSSLLSDADESIRLAAIEGLGSFGIASFEEVPLFGEIVKRGTDREKIYALRSLSQIGRPAKTLIPTVMQALKSNKPAIREAACETLASIGTVVGNAAVPVIDSLKDPNKYVRRSAAFALREINPDDPRAIAGLLKALNDPDLGVQQDVIGALGSYGGRAKSALKTLRSLNKPGLGNYLECATSRITTDNAGEGYRSMNYRSSIPALPGWPPPEASDQVDSGDEYLRGASTMGQIYERLGAILRPLGYSFTVVEVPGGGFALATRMEQFDPVSGVSRNDPARWSDEPYDPSILGGLRIVVFGEDVNQRVFLFVITNQDLRTIPDASLRREALRDWVSAKGHYLPNSLKGVSANGVRCLIMVYHFTGRERIFTLNPRTLPTDIHLEKAGIKKRLESYANY